MANTVGNGLALAAGSLAFFYVVRMKRTYFLDSRFFMGVANVAFNVILVEDLISGLENIPPSQILFTGMIGVTAICIGFASYLLKRNVEQSGISELTAFLSNPSRQFLAYTFITLVWTACGIVLQPWSLEPSLAAQGVFHYTYQLWYLGLSAILVMSFIFLPVLGMYVQSRGLSDSRASRSVRIIGLSWAGFGGVSFLQVALAETQSAGILAESLLFLAIAFALREPTVLSRIISSISTSDGAVYSEPGADTVVLYNTDSDRRALLEAFAREELGKQRRAVCLVGRAEVALYTAILKGVKTSRTSDHAVDDIQVLPIEEFLREPAEKPSTILSDIDDELLDLGELDASQSRLVIDRAKSLDATSTRKRSRIWAVDVENVHPEILTTIRTLNPMGRTIDQAGHQDSFASIIGKRHQDIVGARFLLEVEPSSPFETLVQRFAEEFHANMEPIAVFTSLGSPVQKQLRNLRQVRFFTFSTKTSTPMKGSGEEVLLPERDSSLLLDAIDKLLQTCRGQNVALAIDVFTDLVLLLGFDKAYGVLSSVMEMLESESATALVLINFRAHDEKVLNGIRGLFRFRLVFDLDGVKLVQFGGPLGRGVEGERYEFVESRSQRMETG